MPPPARRCVRSRRSPGGRRGWWGRSRDGAALSPILGLVPPDPPAHLVRMPVGAGQRLFTVFILRVCFLYGSLDRCRGGGLAAVPVWLRGPVAAGFDGGHRRRGRAPGR